VTLLARAHNDSLLRQAEGNLKSVLKTLEVKLDISRANAQGWIKVSISGEDEKVALQYLTEKIGLCPVELEKIAKFSTFKGFITDGQHSKNELRVDIGVFAPERVEASIPLCCLQAQLGDGRKIAIAKLRELFGLRENVPLDVRITNVDFQKRLIEAEFSDKQQKQFSDWTQSMLDRLLIIGASYSGIKSTVRKLQIDRDVVKIETLGMFEYAVVCKLGTDAAGLIPKIGKNLERAVFTVFNPRNILRLLGSEITFSTF
jgi:hypothetical protein